LSKVAWVIPTHPPKYADYRKHLRLSRLFVRDIQHVCVLTYRDEAKSFLRGSIFRPDHIIVLEDHFSREVISLFLTTRSIINVKKLLAVKLLQHDFSHIIVSDSEVQVFRHLHSADIVHREAVFPFHKVDNPRCLEIIAAPVDLLVDTSEKDFIRKNFVQPGLYGWFSDLPIYTSAHLEGFWPRFGLERLEDFSRINFDTFDFILFQYHMALEARNSDKKCWFVYEWDFPSSGGSCWEMGYISDTGIDYLRQDGIIRRPLWISHRKLVHEVQSAKIIFNSDRDFLPSRKEREYWRSSRFNRLLSHLKI